MSNIKERLTKLAHRVTIPFCVHCERESDLEWCQDCGRDNLARFLPGRYYCDDTDWVIEDLLFRNLRSVVITKTWRIFYTNCWGWLVAKFTKEELISFDEKRYYRRSDIEHFLDAAELHQGK
ncbi:MAG: hypothetical protein JST16_05415 [Bdellovibrionales bacterium]|nr:hypothetical protein [Bdellovibrionales bacterium]